MSLPSGAVPEALAMVTQSLPGISALSWRARRPWVRRRLRAALIAGSGGWRTVPELIREAQLPGLPPREAQAVISGLVEAGAAEGIRGRRGWSRVRGLAVVPEAPFSRPAPALDRSRRPFSVGTRVRRHRSSRPLSGVLLFVVAILAATAVAFWLIRSWDPPSDAGEAPAPTARDRWYQQVAQQYIDGYLDGRPGFTLPYRFTEISGVAAGAPRSHLESGIDRYLRAALFLGYPSHGGILGWARREFGELPGGGEADNWFRRVAETYAARSLAGAPGYEITPALAAAGEIADGERDQTALAAGLVRALRSAVFLGTPQPGGVLDWARRTAGDLPTE